MIETVARWLCPNIYGGRVWSEVAESEREHLLLLAAELLALIGDGEPVGWVTPQDLGRIQALEPVVPRVNVWAEPGKGDIPLYLHPAPEREALEILDRAVGLHESLEVLYVVDGYEASLTARDGAATTHSVHGRSVLEAIRKLADAILAREKDDDT